ncbi:MAG TPA: hypothetical protein VHV75_15115 [Solirubrobacteraceae bacterium]|jgi:hypothetical protein|nr:hypothetical protein [Solirubrobacteraceae bacterium]
MLGPTTTAVDSNPSESDSADRGLKDLALKAVPAIGSAIGIVGFVAAIGGAIEWVRFNAAGLPATQAVSAAPKGELVITGAWALAVFLLFAFLAVLLVFVWDRSGIGGMTWGIGVLTVVEVGLVAYMTGGATALGELFGALVVVGALLSVGKTIGAAVPRSSSADALMLRSAETHVEQSKLQADRARKRLEELRAKSAPATVVSESEASLASALRTQQRAEDRLQKLFETLDRRYSRALDGSHSPTDRAQTTLGPDAQTTVGPDPDELKALQAKIKPPEAPTLEVARLQFGGWLILALLIIGLGLAILLDHNARWLAITIGATLLLNGILLGTARFTDSLAVCCTAVFASVLLLGGLTEVARTSTNLYLQPAAAIRKGDDVAVCGVYITETSTRLYLADVPTTTTAKRNTTANLFWIPDAEIDMVKIGKLAPEKKLASDDQKLAAALYLERGEQPASPAPATTTTSVVDTTSKTGTTTTTDSSTTITNGDPAKPSHPLFKAQPPSKDRCSTSVPPATAAPKSDS